METRNPATMQLIKSYKEHTEETPKILKQVQEDWINWKATSFSERKSLMLKLAGLLRSEKERLGNLITTEMGKILSESIGEIEKCAWVCEYYAEEAESMLEDESFESNNDKAFAAFEPLGIVLAVMPWNYPFWQVFRFAAPGLMAGNACVLKHASNVPGCAMEIESLFRRAGFPTNLFRTLLIPGSRVSKIIEHEYVRAITLTGSELAGSQVASKAGNEIKKTLLELGGSDAFIVLKDADLESCTSAAVAARMMNAGQSCIAAKRFLVEDSVFDEFQDLILKKVISIKTGDPLDPSMDMGPMARPDLREELHDQVIRSVALGAKILTGGKPVSGTACFYEPTLLTDVNKDMPVFTEETFGPVLPLIRFSDEQEAIELANLTELGLSGSIWTSDVERGIRIARHIETGAMFVNGIPKSDPRVPFGGIGRSGYGRELSYYGIKEFVNIKTICVG